MFNFCGQHDVIIARAQSVRHMLTYIDLYVYVLYSVDVSAQQTLPLKWLYNNST